jgi:tRNA A37 threonylcarbamoyladenosine dehydratase
MHDSPATAAAFQRARLLIGDAGLARLLAARVAVFGLGGVGGHAAEALLRAPVGHLTLVDADVVQASNLNRQLAATLDALGQPKAAVLAERFRRIRPEAEIVALHRTFSEDVADELLAGPFDYVVDAIDSLSAKVALLAGCQARGLPVVSSMGAACKFDPLQVRVGDLFQTRHCPLARFVRKRLRRRGIAGGVLCVYSAEPPTPNQPLAEVAEEEARLAAAGQKRQINGTLSYLPALFGLHCAAVVIRHLLEPRP